MSEIRSLGLGRGTIGRREGSDVEHVILQRPLDRIFAFTGYSIDSVVNNPIAKNAVLGYFKLQRQIERSIEITELERQWNR